VTALPRQRGFTALLVILLALSSTGYFALSPSGVQAANPTALGSTFAPVLHFTSGEKFYPTSVDYLITSSILRERFSNGSSLVVDSSPSPSTLGTHNSTDFYLDNRLSTLDAITSDYSSKASTLGYFTYIHLANSSSTTVIQYWLFYAYNNGPLNDHQGDLEVVEIFLDSSGSPFRALYSQHGAGENAAWSEVDKVDTHTVVSVAEGSQAHYFRP